MPGRQPQESPEETPGPGMSPLLPAPGSLPPLSPTVKSAAEGPSWVGTVSVRTGGLPMLRMMDRPMAEHS